MEDSVSNKKLSQPEDIKHIKSMASLICCPTGEFIQEYNQQVGENTALLKPMADESTTGSDQA